MAYDKDGAAWKWLDTRMISADRPYSARAMFDRLSNLRNLARKRGSHCFVPFGSTGFTNTGFVKNRPYTSVAGWSAFYLLPYMVNPGLHEIHVQPFCRTSNGGKDSTGGDFLNSDDWEVTIRGALVDNSPKPGTRKISAPVSSNDAVWFAADPLIIPVNTSVLQYTIYDVLVLEIKTAPIYGSAGELGASYSELFESGFAGLVVDLTTDTFYGDDTAASSPQSDSNWITCSEVYNSFVSGNPSTFHDHVYAFDSQTAVIRPDADQPQGAVVQKRYIPYVQFRGLQVLERYDSRSGVLGSSVSVKEADLSALREANPQGPGALALDALGVYRRHELVCGKLDTLLDNDGSLSNEWADRGYPMFPYVHGKLSTGLSLTFANANPDTITVGVSTWITDGFTADEQIEVIDSTSNDGLYTVNASTAPTATILTLDPADTLAIEGPTASCDVLRSGSRTFSAGGSTRFNTPKFHVLMAVVGAHQALRDSVLWRALLQTFGVTPAPVPQDADANTIFGAVSFTVAISQGGTDVATQTLTEERITYWPSTIDAPQHLQAVRHCMSTPDGADLGLRWGMLDFDLGQGADAAMIHPVAMEIPLDGGASFDPDLPVTISLRVDQVRTDDLPDWVEETDSKSDITMDEMRLDIVGFGVWASDNA